MKSIRSDTAPLVVMVIAQFAIKSEGENRSFLCIDDHDDDADDDEKI